MTILVTGGANLGVRYHEEAFVDYRFVAVWEVAKSKKQLSFTSYM